MEPFSLELNYVEAENDPLRYVSSNFFFFCFFLFSVPRGSFFFFLVLTSSSRLPENRRFVDFYTFEGIPANGTDPALNSENFGEKKVSDDSEEEPVPVKSSRKNNKKKGAKEEIKGFYNMTAVPKVFLKLELVDGGMISVSAYAEVHHSEQVTRKIKKNATVTIEAVEETEKAEGKAEDTKNDEDKAEREGKEDSEEENKEDEDEKVEGEDNNNNNDDEEKKVEKEEGEEKKEEEKKAEDEFEVVTEWVAKRVEVPLKIKQKFGPLPATLRKKSKEVIAELDKAEKLRVKIQESKNELEGKIYSVKSGIEDPELIQVTTEDQRSELRALLAELSDWVEYEAEAAELLEIREKKNSLDKLVKPIYLRITEKEALPREGTFFFF